MKRLFSMLLAVTMLLTLLAGCSAGESKAPEAAAPSSGGETAENIELTMWTFLNPNDENATGRALALRMIIEEFQKANPGITVKVEPQEHSTLPAKVYAAYANGEAPDVFQVSVGTLGTGIELGVMATLEELFYDDWTEEEKADVASGRWEAGADENGHYQVPVFGCVYGIFYRKDLFEEFGIKAEDIKTWEDLYVAAEKLTYVNEDGLQVYGLGAGYATSAVDANYFLPLALVNQEGGVFTEDGYPNNWTGEAAQAALKKQLEAVERGITPESCVSMDYEDVQAGFEAGQYAMAFGGNLRTTAIMGNATFDPSYVGFMPYPEMELGSGNDTFTGGWYTCVNSASAHKEAAGKFLEFICSSEADELWITVADQVPLRQSSLEKLSDYIAKPGNEWIATAASKLPGAYTAPETFVTKGMQEDWQNAFIRAYSEGMSVEEALKSAEDDFISRNVNR